MLHSERNETINREDEFSTGILTGKRILATASRTPESGKHDHRLLHRSGNAPFVAALEQGSAGCGAATARNGVSVGAGGLRAAAAATSVGEDSSGAAADTDPADHSARAGGGRCTLLSPWAPELLPAGVQAGRGDDDDAAALRARVEAFADPFRDDWAAWRREEGPAGRLGQGWEDGLARARVLELPSRGEPSESPTASRPEAPRP